MSARAPEVIRSAAQLGLLIGRERSALRLSQRALGEQVGVKQSTVGKWEQAEHAPRSDDLLAALDALGLEMVIRPRRTHHRVTTITALWAVIENGRAS